MADAKRAQRTRLDQPAEPGRRRLRGPNVDPEAFGVLTERIARFLGTGKYLVIQSVIIIVWMGYGALKLYLPQFDAYPYPFLTLVLSLQAAYAAPLILLAQNRQDDRDRVNLLEDRDRSNRNLEDTEYLARELADIRFALGEAVTRDFLRDELRDLLAEITDRQEQLGDRVGSAVPPGAVKKKKRKPRRPHLDRPEAEGGLSEPQRPDSHVSYDDSLERRPVAPPNGSTTPTDMPMPAE